MGNATAKSHTYSLTQDHKSLDLDRNGPCDFSYCDNGSDLVLVIEGRRLYVHRKILAEYSPVFSAMLNDDFKEREAKEIPLPGKGYIEYRELLRAVYCHGAAHCNKDKSWPYFHSQAETFLLHNENVYYLLSLSDEYQIDAIKDKCEEFLCLTTTRSNVSERLYLAELYDLKKLLKTIIPIAAKISSHRLKSSPYYTHISDKVRISVKVTKKCLKKRAVIEEHNKKKYIFMCRAAMGPMYSVNYLSPSVNVSARDICHAYAGVF